MLSGFYIYNYIYSIYSIYIYIVYLYNVAFIAGMMGKHIGLTVGWSSVVEAMLTKLAEVCTEWVARRSHFTPSVATSMPIVAWRNACTRNEAGSIRKMRNTQLAEPKLGLGTSEEIMNWNPILQGFRVTPRNWRLSPAQTGEDAADWGGSNGTWGRTNRTPGIRWDLCLCGVVCRHVL